MNGTEINVKFKNQVTGQKKIEQYAQNLKTIHAVLDGIDKGKMAEVERTSGEIRNVANSLERMNKTGGKLLMIEQFKLAFNALSRLARGFTSAAKSAGDYAENIDLYKVAFNNATEEADKLVSRLKDMYGLDPNSIYRSLGVFKQMANTMNYAGDTAERLALHLTQMQVDMSSLYNVDIDRAGSVLQSAMSQQTEAIRALTGADITQMNMQKLLDDMGVDRLVRGLSQAEKRLLIMVSLTKQLEVSQGDFARTIEGTAQQITVLKQQWQMLTRNIGSIFIPLLTQMLPYLNAILMVLNAIIETIAKFFGYEVEDFAIFNKSEDFYDDHIDGINGVTAANKKLKQGLRGFDKLNNITTPTDSGGGAGVGGGSAIIDPRIQDAFNKAFEGYQEKLANIKMRATEIKEQIMDWLGFTQKTNGEWEWSAKKFLKNIIKSFLELNTLGKIFAGLGLIALFKGLVGLGNKLLGGFITPLIKVLSKSGGMLGQILTDTLNLKDGQNGLAGAFLKSTREANKNLTVYKKYKTESGQMVDVVDKTATTWNKAKTALSGMLLVLGGAGLAFDVFKGVSEDGITFKNVIMGIGSAIAIFMGTMQLLVLVLGEVSLGVAAATGGISLLIPLVMGVVGWFANKKNAVDELTQTLEEYDNQLNTVIETAKENIATAEIQAAHHRDLVGELEGLVDANNRVKASDEGRVHFILNELNNAYGTEYKLINGKITEQGKEIKSIGKVKEAIEKLIETKKIENQLKAHEVVYQEALRQSGKLVEELTRIEGDNNLTQEEKVRQINKIKKAYEDNQKKIQGFEEAQGELLKGNIKGAEEIMDKFYKTSKKSYDMALKDAEDSVGVLQTNVKKTADKVKNEINNAFMKSRPEMNIKTKVDASSYNNFINDMKRSTQGKDVSFSFPSAVYPRYKSGISFVPNDFHPAFLDYGERVLTRTENIEYTKAISGGSQLGGNTSQAPIHLTVQVGDEVIAKKVIKDLQEMAKSNGRPIEIY